MKSDIIVHLQSQCLRRRGHTTLTYLSVISMDVSDLSSHNESLGSPSVWYTADSVLFPVRPFHHVHHVSVVHADIATALF